MDVEKFQRKEWKATSRWFIHLNCFVFFMHFAIADRAIRCIVRERIFFSGPTVTFHTLPNNSISIHWFEFRVSIAVVQVLPFVLLK